MRTWAAVALGARRADAGASDDPTRRTAGSRGRLIGMPSLRRSGGRGSLCARRIDDADPVDPELAPGHERFVDLLIRMLTAALLAP